MHVDEFINNPCSTPEYVRFFFMLKRLPAEMQIAFHKWINPYKLFCTWEGKRYRVTGCSRFGDVWLSINLEREIGYDERVNLTECTEWSETP